MLLLGLWAAVAVLFAPGASAQSAPDAVAAGWEKIDEKDGVTVYKKKMPGTSLVAFRGDAVIDAPLGKILWIMGDNEHRKEWIDRLQKTVVLQRNGPYDYTVYQHFGLPFPISDRDYVYRGQMVSNADGSVTLRMHSVEHPKAPETVGVRANLIRSSYLMIPVSDTRTRVIVEIFTDPRGSLPAWLVNMIQRSWPVKTLSALAEHVKKPFIRSVPPP